MMRSPLRSLATATVTALALGAAAGSGSAGPEKVAFPVDFDKGVLYTVADRYDVKQYRELYASPEAIRAAREGKPLPHGTVLTLVQYRAQVDAQGTPLKNADGRFLKGDLIGYAVMEKRQGWGAEYPEDLRNGEWEYALFTADRKPNEKANFKACFQCHKPHAGQDFVISYPALAGRTTVAVATPAAAGAVPVKIAAFAFGPATVTVEPGRPVVWTNEDLSPHQVTFTKTQERSPILVTGQTHTRTFSTPGVHEYICGLHPSMKGSIEVK
jgi:plastocyanin